MNTFLVFLLVLVAPALAASIPHPVPVLVQRQASCTTLPSGYSPPTVSKLPDPFTFANGTKVTTKDDFACRQQQISQLFQRDELGIKPPKPSTLTATLSSNTLTVNAGENNESISFSASIKYPSTGAAPYPAFIAFQGGSIPIPAGVAVINFNNDDIAAEVDSSSRGQGKFYTLYGTSASAGALTAWAWGVSRIIDALEITPGANINTARIGVTGCSRDGKGAFVAGALDTRIALTIPQESGSGGAACWRISDDQQRKGANIQTAGEIVGENVWFSTNFNQYSKNTVALPEDHHMLAALVAPRGLFVIENDIDWLGPVSTTGCMQVGSLVYQALGASEAMGFSLVGNHAHCAFPSASQADLTAYVTKYLLGGNTSTSNIFESSYNVTLTDWIDWTPPNLS